MPAVIQHARTHQCSVSFVPKIQLLGPFPTDLSPRLAYKAFFLGAQPCARCQEALVRRQRKEEAGLFW